jgi:hypothetical protein
MKRVLAVLLAAVALAGCDDDDSTPPAAPRGLYSVTGDHEVTLRWLANTERDVAGYRIYVSTCASGPDCPYDRVASTAGTAYVVTSLANGTTRYFAVAAYDDAGNESELTRADIFDTPRPEGTGLLLTNYVSDPDGSGWDFSEFLVRPYDHPEVDIFYGRSGNLAQMIAPFEDTEIQDAGYATDLDAVDYAPASGWSPTGTVELIPGHCYVVWTHGDHYAKFRVTRLTTATVELEWAYQVDPGNPELKPDRAPQGGARVRRVLPRGA